MPSEPTRPGEPSANATGSRRGRRAREVSADPLAASERHELLSVPLRDALGRGVSAADWITNHDAPTVAIAARLVELIDPAPTGVGITGEPIAGPSLQPGDRLRALHDLADVLASLGLSAEGRRALGIVLVVAPDPNAGRPGARRAPRRRPTFAKG